MVTHKPDCPNVVLKPLTLVPCDCGIDTLERKIESTVMQADIDRLGAISKIIEEELPKPEITYCDGELLVGPLVPSWDLRPSKEDVVTPLQVLALAILDNPLAYQWSVQGFGVLRLYIRDVGRLHIWDSALRYPGVSMIHNHSWDLRSTVIFGCLVNTRFTTTPPEGYVPWPRPERYEGKRLITGYQTRDVVTLEPVTLYPNVVETFRSGDEYAQKAHEIHRTDAFDGTVTLMLRKEDENGQADVYWPAGTEWGTAKPRPATPEEVKNTVDRALLELRS